MSACSVMPVSLQDILVNISITFSDIVGGRLKDLLTRLLVANNFDISKVIKCDPR